MILPIETSRIVCRNVLKLNVVALTALGVYLVVVLELGHLIARSLVFGVRLLCSLVCLL